jgi:hypothetical protein
MVTMLISILQVSAPMVGVAMVGMENFIVIQVTGKICAVIYNLCIVCNSFTQ